MKVRLVGWREVKGTYEGNAYHNTNMYCVDTETQQDGLMGCKVVTIKVPMDRVSLPPLVLDGDYVVYYDQYGKVDVVIEAGGAFA